MKRLNTESTNKYGVSVDRLWSYIDKGSDDECWEWQACRDGNGYGMIRTNLGMRRSHRILYGLLAGEEPEYVCHHCDNPSCCNPKHLFPGNPLINNRDRNNKGRTVTQHGEDHPLHKLTEEQVIEIRKQVKTVGITNRELASKYNVSNSLIRNIRLGKAWRHVG